MMYRAPLWSVTAAADRPAGSSVFGRDFKGVHVYGTLTYTCEAPQLRQTCLQAAVAPKVWTSGCLAC